MDRSRVCKEKVADSKISGYVVVACRLKASITLFFSLFFVAFQRPSVNETELNNDLRLSAVMHDCMHFRLSVVMSHITVFIVSLPANTFSAVSPRSSLSHGKIIPKQPSITRYIQYDSCLLCCQNSHVYDPPRFLLLTRTKRAFSVSHP